jgi:hypothetical protein
MYISALLVLLLVILVSGKWDHKHWHWHWHWHLDGVFWLSAYRYSDTQCHVVVKLDVLSHLFKMGLIEHLRIKYNTDHLIDLDISNK